MNTSEQDVLKAIAEYYSDKLAAHGQSPQGVDWNGEHSQALRFQQLSKVIDSASKCSVNDLGCGYGGYLDYLLQISKDIRYAGFDLSADMIAAAQQRFAGNYNSRFVLAGEPDSIADFGIASGIFNVRLHSADDAWKAYILRTLDILDHTSDRGFAFNCLTSYSDSDKMRKHLYYANPSEIFDHCKRKYSRNVALLHDYELYEFTILVRK